MSATMTLEAQPRDPAKNKGTGSRASRRLREKGQIPAVIYGHKQANATISIARDDIWKMIKQQSHLAELKVGGAAETVMVKALQWDYLGRDIIHVDFARVDLNETIDTTVRLEIKGTPKGAAEGGTLELLTHEVRINCRAVAIPDSIKVDVSALSVGDSIHGRDLKLGEGILLKGDPDLMLLHVVAKPAGDAAGEGDAKKAEPEVIKKEKKKDEKPAK